MLSATLRHLAHVCQSLHAATAYSKFTIPSLQVGRTVDAQLAAMSGHRLAPFGSGDEDSGKLQEQFQSWAQGILDAQTQQTNAAAVVEELQPIVEQVSQQLWYLWVCEVCEACVWHLLSDLTAEPSFQCCTKCCHS